MSVAYTSPTPSAAAPLAATDVPGPLRGLGLAAWQSLERALDPLVGPGLNPLRQLGALGFLCFWLLALSGIYLYAVLDTSAAGAYTSIERLQHAPWYAGGWLRSLHRYAADAFVLLMLAHGLREWLHGHYRGFRRFSWLTGVPLVAFVFVCAIGGFWLNWDQLGQFSAIATAEWLDALPGLAAPLARNFLSADAVSDRLFSLFVFVHLGVPLLLVFGLWFHIQRISLAAVFPPRPVALAAGGALVLLALAWPVTQHPPADVTTVPASLAMDWLLLFVHPLVYATSAGFVWWALAAAAVALFALPFWPARRAAAQRDGSARVAADRAAASAVAVVDADNCNGCRRCFADCPYAAITMRPHPNQKLGKELAEVNADLCAGCGICAGACPSSTPFRSSAELVTGIDMPQLTVQTLRQQLRAGLQRPPHAAPAPPGQPIVVFSCQHGVAADTLQDDALLHLPLLCTGMLPPSFIDYALRDGAAGVIVSGCAEGGCEFRLGQRWTAERLAGRREPQLRASVPAERLMTVWAAAGDRQALPAALSRLRQRLRDHPHDPAHDGPRQGRSAAPTEPSAP